MIEAARRYNRVVAGRHAAAQRRGSRQGGPVPARWRARHGLRGEDGRLPAARSDRRRRLTARCRRASTTICGSGRRPRVRSTRTISTITGTGSGNTARPTSATPASIRSTPCAGCSANRSIREPRIASAACTRRAPERIRRRRIRSTPPISMRTEPSCTATCATGSAVRPRRTACTSPAPRAG